MRGDGMTYQQIAEHAGITKQGAHKAVGELSTQLTTERVTGKDGKSYPARKPRAGTPGIHTTDADKAQRLMERAPEAVGDE